MSSQKPASAKLPASIQTPPPAHDEHVILSYPAPHVLLVTFNRASALNAIHDAMRLDLEAVFDWFETEPDLWVAVVTGTGRAFCAGADLKS